MKCNSDPDMFHMFMLIKMLHMEICVDFDLVRD